MLEEAKKREKVANAFLAATMAASAAQSPKDFVKTGHVEAPGTALMQMWAKKRGEAERNLDSGRVSHPARNRKVKSTNNQKLLNKEETQMINMKTFSQFLEEAYLVEMRKEDKVAGKKKTPLYLTKKYKTVQKAPEGSGKKWETRTVEKKQINPTASLGRFKQGKEGGAPAIQAGGTHGGPTMGYKPHTHGEGGSGRGVKKERGAKIAPKPGTTATDRVQAKRKAVDSWRGQYGGRYSIWGAK